VAAEHDQDLRNAGVADVADDMEQAGATVDIEQRLDPAHPLAEPGGEHDGRDHRVALIRCAARCTASMIFS
jgi:hypothetical protein